MAAKTLTTDKQPSGVSWHTDRSFVLVLACAAILGIIYNFVILPGYGPDEPRHFAYVKLLFEERRFPFLQADGSEYHGAHSLHPPLYYFVLLPFYVSLRMLPEAAVYHGLRFVSCAMGLISLIFFYETILRVAGRNAARLSAAILALIPIFGMTSGVVNNDSASLLAVSVFFWLLCVRYADDVSPRAALWLGVALGLGMLCKATVALCAGAALVVYLWSRYGLRSIIFWRNLVISLATALVIGAPWYGRNFALYGKFSPIESGYSNPALPNPSSGALVMMMHDNFPPLFAHANWMEFYSLWSQKDWFPESMRPFIYGILALLTVAAAAGNTLAWKRHEPNTSQERSARRAIYGGFALLWVACLGMALFVHWGWAEGGRYLLAGVGAVALFLALGWQGLISESNMPVALKGWIGFALLLNAICVYWLLVYLNPTFGPK